MPPIETALDAALDAWQARTDPQRQRGRMADGVFQAKRTRALADRQTHPLRRARLLFRGGITASELSQRSTVSERVIRRAEAGEDIGDASWNRLARALTDDPTGITRTRRIIDPTFPPT